MPTTRTAVVLGILGLILLAAIAYLLWGGNDVDPVVTASETTVTEAELVFLNLTAQIGELEFDKRILTDQRFISLQDLRTAIVPEASGRPDPFAPLPGVSEQ